MNGSNQSSDIFLVVSPSWYELMRIDSMLWGKNCTSYKGWKWGGFS